MYLFILEQCTKSLKEQKQKYNVCMQSSMATAGQ